MIAASVLTAAARFLMALLSLRSCHMSASVRTPVVAFERQAQLEFRGPAGAGTAPRATRSMISAIAGRPHRPMVSRCHDRNSRIGSAAVRGCYRTVMDGFRAELQISFQATKPRASMRLRCAGGACR